MEMKTQDNVAMDAEDVRRLHEAIEKGEIEVVRSLLLGQAAGQCFLYDEQSALYRALNSNKYDIAAYLIRMGAKIDEQDSKFELDDLFTKLDRLNYHLLQYNKRTPKSCVFQLTSWSQSPQVLDGERLNAVIAMYDDFFQCKYILSLMKVLEREPIDLVYDFESEDVNRMYRYCLGESENSGLTLLGKRMIYVGAKNLLSTDSKKKKDVYGKVAEELCHMALASMFGNSDKPYREENFKLEREFLEILIAVKNSSFRSSHIECVIEDVFYNYFFEDWGSELIARVPHVMGKYGEELGREIFLESRELSMLLSFYEENVLPKCDEYTDPSLNTEPHKKMERMMKKYDFISLDEKKVKPLREDFPSFKDFLVDEEGFSVITSNCIKLCTLQVFHELQIEYGDLMRKKCLFFSGECFEKKREKIRDALRKQHWDYLVVVLDERVLNLQIFQKEYLYSFGKFTSNEMELILILDWISGCNALDKKFQNRALHYRWDDVSNEYKVHLKVVNYLFRGVAETVFVDDDDLSKVFTEEEIFRIVDGEVFTVGDSSDLFCKDFDRETHVEREFKIMAVDRKIFESLSPETSIFLTGCDKMEYEKLNLLNEKDVQWIQGSGDEVQVGKSIYIASGPNAMNFKDFARRNEGKMNVWLHYCNKLFHLRNNHPPGDLCTRFVKRITIRETEMLDSLERNGKVIISADSGHGKSHSMSSIISSVKEQSELNPLWILRIDFKKISSDKDDPLSLAHITPARSHEEVLDHFCRMNGLTNVFQKFFFRKQSERCCLFFDGYDEVPSKYKANASTLLSTLMTQTSAKMLVTTRRHCQEELENILNTSSYELVPFSREQQVIYLDNFWKRKLKYPRGNESPTYSKYEIETPEKIVEIIEELRKVMDRLDSDHSDLVRALQRIDLNEGLDKLRLEIEKLDFRKLAARVIDDASFEDESVELTAIPLHLNIIGRIHYDCNFSERGQSYIYHLFCKLIEQKIKVYLTGKQGVRHDGCLRELLLHEIGNVSVRVHSELSYRMMIEEGVNLASSVRCRDLEIISGIGIVSIDGEEVKFLHESFASFFLVESLNTEFEEKLFIEALTNPKRNVVRSFLLGGLQSDNLKNLTQKIIEDIDILVAVMDTMISTYSSDVPDFESFYPSKIVRNLLRKFEEVVEEKLANDFIEKVETVLNGLSKKEARSFNHNCIFKILDCLTGKMLKKLIASGLIYPYENCENRSNLLLSVVRWSVDPQEVIEVLKECISVKTLCESEVGSSDVGNADVGKGENESERLLSLLGIKDTDGNSFFYHALRNGRAEVFARILQFLRDVMRDEQLSESIFKSDYYRSELKAYVDETQPSELRRSFEKFRATFGNDLEFFCDNYYKYLLTNRAVECD